MTVVTVEIVNEPGATEGDPGATFRFPNCDDGRCGRDVCRTCRSVGGCLFVPPPDTEGGPGASAKALARAWASGPCRAGRQRIEDAGCVDDLADLIQRERTQSRAAVVAEIVAWTKDHSFEFADQVSAAIEAKWGKGGAER